MKNKIKMSFITLILIIILISSFTIVYAGSDDLSGITGGMTLDDPRDGR